MMHWLTRKLLGPTARAGELVLDDDLCLVMLPQSLASIRLADKNLSPGGPAGVSLAAHPDAKGSAVPSIRSQP